jgi:hypothetical protein
LGPVLWYEKVGFIKTTAAVREVVTPALLGVGTFNKLAVLLFNE